jgi:hypothetical protein
MKQFSSSLSQIDLIYIIFLYLNVNVATARSRIPGHWFQPPPPADEVWATQVNHR